MSPHQTDLLDERVVVVVLVVVDVDVDVDVVVDVVDGRVLLTMLHVEPIHCGVHMQIKLFTPLKQDPPLRHGLGEQRLTPGDTVVVVTSVVISASQRCPVYAGGQSHTTAFPFTRHVPPERQIPGAHVATGKHFSVLLDIPMFTYHPY